MLASAAAEAQRWRKPDKRKNRFGDLRANLPNGITLAGFALGVWWCTGGPAWAALASIIMDELDGHIARARGEATQYGSLLDWGSDLTLTGMSLVKLGAPWAIPFVTASQVALRNGGYRPPVGSARAALMLAGVAR
jgi:phosphatidylglycerophosphate synthase